MWNSTLLLLCLAIPAFAAEKLSAPQLIDLAKSNRARLQDAIVASFEAKDLKEGTAWAGRGPDFFFATQANSQPSLVIDQGPGPQVQHLAGSDLWYVAAHIEPVGRLHSFHYFGQRREVRRQTGSAGIRSSFLSATRCCIRHAIGQDRPYQQDLRRHEK